MGTFKSIHGKIFGIDSETGQIIQGGTLAAANNGVKTGTTVKVAETGGPVLHRTVLTFTATPITLTDDAGAGQYGGTLIYTFPQGLIGIHGAVVTGSLTILTGTIIDNFDGFVALGTVTATTGATLTGTEANIMPAVAISAGAADKIAVVDAGSVATALTESGSRWIDGTTTAVPMFLNFLVTDDATHTSGTAKFDGTVVFNWENLGDNA